MENKPEKPKKVEELQNFPFENFREFRKAYASLEGIIHPITLDVDRGVAREWAQGNVKYGSFQTNHLKSEGAIYDASELLRIQVLILAFLPYVTAIGFLIYAIASKSWLLLLGLPILPIAFFIFNPSARMIFGFIRSLFIFLTFAGFIWALLAGKPGLLALTIPLLIIWYAQRTIYKKAVSNLIAIAAAHEDVLCLLWHAKALNIRLDNGNTYSADGKIENGQERKWEPSWFFIWAPYLFVYGVSLLSIIWNLWLMIFFWKYSKLISLWAIFAIPVLARVAIASYCLFGPGGKSNLSPLLWENFPRTIYRYGGSATFIDIVRLIIWFVIGLIPTFIWILSI